MPRIIDEGPDTTPVSSSARDLTAREGLEEMPGRKTYKYPGGMDLRPGSPSHERIVKEVLKRVDESYDMLSERRDKYRKIDKKLTSFIDLSDDETAEKADDDRRPMSLVVPVSYANLQTVLTYWTGIFTSDDFIFRFGGAGPEDALGALLMERVIDVHVRRRKMILTLHTMWRDALAYGVGIVVPRWTRIIGKRSVPEVVGRYNAEGDFKRQSFRRNTVDSLLYEGCELDTIDPYLYFPDPNVPVHRVQDGEFVAWLTRTNVLDLMSEEDDSGGDIFNVGFVRDKKNNESRYYDDSESKRDPIRDSYGTTATTTRAADVLNIYMKIIPREWKLGESERVEKWLFSIVGDRTLIRAQPINLDHDMFPVVVCAPEFDGHSSTAISATELTFGIQELIDWLMSSHVTNVRKSLNDMFLVDPWRVDLRDFKDPERRPGGIIKMRRAAWGSGVEGAIQQLPVADVTAQHIGDISYLSSVIQQVTGATDVVQGLTNRKGEAKTAQEVRDAKTAAVSRLEKGARMGAIMAHTDIGHMFATYVQQFMTEDLYVKTIGEHDDALRREFGIQGDVTKVRPIDVQVRYDVIANDGFTKGGEFIEAWTNVFQTIAQSPELSQQFDVNRIFRHLARLMGANNLSQFETRQQPNSINITPDEIVEQKLASGQFVPVQENPFATIA